MRSLVIALLLVFTHFTAYTQQLSLSIDEVMNVAQLLPDEVEVVGSSQGMAIWRRYAFLMHDKGQCVVVDMRRGEYVNTFKMVATQATAIMHLLATNIIAANPVFRCFM